MSNTKHQLRYSVQYDFIPELVEVVFRDILSCAIFYLFDIWEKILKDKYGSFFELEEGYDCKVIEINDRYDLYFYTFPEPEGVPDALYGAIVADKQEHTYIYDTLEMSFDGSWIIGSKANGSHYNYGELDSHTPEAFIKWLLSTLK